MLTYTVPMLFQSNTLGRIQTFNYLDEHKSCAWSHYTLITAINSFLTWQTTLVLSNTSICNASSKAKDQEDRKINLKHSENAMYFSYEFFTTMKTSVLSSFSRLVSPSGHAVLYWVWKVQVSSKQGVRIASYLFPSSIYSFSDNTYRGNYSYTDPCS